MGATEAWQQGSDLFGMRRAEFEDRRGSAARSSRSAVAEISNRSGGGILSSSLSEMRSEGGDRTAIAEQSAFQQGLRRCSRNGLRIGGSPAGGASIPVGV